MKFDLNADIFDDPTKRVIQLATPGQPVDPLPLSQLAFQLLLANNPNAAQPSAEIKVKHYQLMTKLLSAIEHANGVVDLTLSEIGIIKGLADTSCPVLVHGRINSILENPLP